MKLLRAFLVLLVLLDYLDPSGGFIGADSSAAQAQVPPIPLVSGPQDLSQMRGTLNTLINEINAILVPAFPAQPGAVNFPNMQATVTGQPGILGLSFGGDPNASLAIQPNGNGNVILFGASGTAQLGTGVLQIGNVASWVPAKGLAPCPAVSGGSTRPLGVGPTVTGYFQVGDWLGRIHSIAACG